MKFLVRLNGGKEPLEVRGHLWEWNGILLATHRSLEHPQNFTTSVVLQGLNTCGISCKTKAEAVAYTIQSLNSKGIDHTNELLAMYEIINAGATMPVAKKQVIPNDGITYYKLRIKEGYTHLNSFLFIKTAPETFFVHSHSAFTHRGCAFTYSRSYYERSANIHYSKDELAGTEYRFDEDYMEVVK